MYLLKSLQTKHFIFIIFISIFFFVSQLYLAWNLPGYRDNTCVPHGFFTLGNTIYSFLISPPLAVLFVSTFVHFQITKGVSIISGGFGGISAIFLFLTTFCTACTLPVISILGFSLGLGFFSIYNIWFKIITVFLVILGLYFLERKITEGCGI